MSSPSLRPASRSRRLCAAAVTSVVIVTGSLAPVAAQNGTPVGSTPGGTMAPSRLATPVFSARRVPGFLRANVDDRRVVEAAEESLDGAPATTCLTITENGRSIVATNPTEPLMPASTLKLVTGKAALDVLGPETRLRTSVRADAKPGPDGTVVGDLYLVGGGDPLLFTEGFRATLKDRNQLGTDFPALADAIKAAGVTRITGNLVGDDSRYDNLRSIPTWDPSYQRDDHVGALSALEVNRGVTGLSKDPDTPASRRQVGDPPLLGAETLESLLEDRGIDVEGDPAVGTAPMTTTELAGIDSLPVKEIVAAVLQWSDNTASESITKEIGLRVTKSGTTQAGIAGTTQHLDQLDLPTAGVTMVDGSGLDRGNRLTCELLTDLLDEEGPDSHLARGLAVAGQSGTLKPRFKKTTVEGKVAAKTGSLNDVSALAGFVDASGVTYTFAMIVNGKPAPGASTTKFEDELMLALTDLEPPTAILPLLPKPPTT